MKFKNLKTGLVWEAEGTLAERLAKDIDYKKIEEEKVEEEKVDGESNSSELKDENKGKKSKKEGE